VALVGAEAIFIVAQSVRFICCVVLPGMLGRVLLRIRLGSLLVGTVSPVVAGRTSAVRMVVPVVGVGLPPALCIRLDLRHWVRIRAVVWVICVVTTLCILRRLPSVRLAVWVLLVVVIAVVCLIVAVWLIVWMLLPLWMWCGVCAARRRGASRLVLAAELAAAAFGHGVARRGKTCGGSSE
jgi:hypothetical protein